MPTSSRTNSTSRPSWRRSGGWWGDEPGATGPDLRRLGSVREVAGEVPRARRPTRSRPICASGEEALRQVPAIAPDIVTMDLEMPGMGGVRAIEEIMRVRPTPILVISSHAGKSSERVAEALAAGALEVLPKDGLRLDRADDVW